MNKKNLHIVKIYLKYMFEKSIRINVYLIIMYSSLNYYFLLLYNIMLLFYIIVNI
jgi:hypothetical protein